MPPPPWNAPAYHYDQTPPSSDTAAAFPIVHCCCQILLAAAAIKCHLYCRRSSPSCLHLSLPLPSLLSITVIKHCHPPLPPTAAAVKCHLCHCPLPSSIATSIECLQMPPPHLNVSTHCRWQRLQREAESGGRGQCLMVVMVGVAAAVGSGSASGSCGRQSMIFWKGGGYYDIFGSVY